MNFRKSFCVLCLLLFCCVATALAGSLSLTLDQRVGYQKALEQVYWQHRIWPKDNAQPKPALETIMPDSAIRSRTEDDLRKSYALDAHWKKSIDAKDLETVIDRMATETRNSGMLRELWTALDNDPYVVAECLARPLLVDRLAQQIDGFDRWWADNKERVPALFQSPVYNYKLPELKSAFSMSGLEIQATAPGAPSGRSGHTAVWTGAEMIVWGGRDTCKPVGSIFICYNTNTGGRFNPATNSGRATSVVSNK